MDNTGYRLEMFSYAAIPTIAAHAKEVTNDREAEEYQRPTHSASQTLCQATNRGTLFDYLDAFEVERKQTKHAYHHNLVSTERRSNIEYDLFTVT